MTALDVGAARWRKSGHGTDTSDCVEVAFGKPLWRKSSYSSDTANCVEVAFVGKAVGVRDSKSHGELALSFPADGWRRFLSR